MKTIFVRQNNDLLLVVEKMKEKKISLFENSD